jgi:hypothetical protein
MTMLCKIIADSKSNSFPLLHSLKEPSTSMRIGNTVFGLFSLARCKSGMGVVAAPWTDWQRTNIVGSPRRLTSLMFSLLRDLRTAILILKSTSLALHDKKTFVTVVCFGHFNFAQFALQDGDYIAKRFFGLIILSLLKMNYAKVVEGEYPTIFMNAELVHLEKLRCSICATRTANNFAGQAQRSEGHDKSAFYTLQFASVSKKMEDSAILDDDFVVVD